MNEPKIDFAALGAAFHEESMQADAIERSRAFEANGFYTYAIASDSEEGFWNNEDGWVYGLADADTFSGEEINDGSVTLPLSSGNDARFIVVNYGG